MLNIYQATVQYVTMQQHQRWIAIGASAIVREGEEKYLKHLRLEMYVL